jgi:hypothetical protein
VRTIGTEEHILTEEVLAARGRESGAQERVAAGYRDALVAGMRR